MYFSNALQLPRGAAWQTKLSDSTLESEEVLPDQRTILSLQLPAAFIIVFDPVTHTTTFLDVKGEPNARAPRAHPSLQFERGKRHGGLAPTRNQLRLTLEQPKPRAAFCLGCS